jgi:class 3 adenylate cyclase
MPRCRLDEKGKGGQVLFSSALRDGLEEPIAHAEPASRFLIL